MSRRDVIRLLENYVFSDDDSSDGEHDPSVQHYYDMCPPRSSYRWWIEQCLNCGKRGHMSKFCDRLAKEPRCTYCGLSGHKRNACLKKKQMEEYNAKRVEENLDDVIVEEVREIPPASAVNTAPESEVVSVTNDSEEGAVGGVVAQESVTAEQNGEKEQLLAELTGILARLLKNV